MQVWRVFSTSLQEAIFHPLAHHWSLHGMMSKEFQLFDLRVVKSELCCQNVLLCTGHLTEIFVWAAKPSVLLGNLFFIWIIWIIKMPGDFSQDWALCEWCKTHNLRLREMMILTSVWVISGLDREEVKFERPCIMNAGNENGFFFSLIWGICTITAILWVLRALNITHI